MTELGEYDMELRYCRGADNIAADALSRIRPVKCDDEPCFDPSYLPTGLKLLKTVPGGGDSLFLSLISALEDHRDRYGGAL